MKARSNLLLTLMCLCLTTMVAQVQNSLVQGIPLTESTEQQSVLISSDSYWTPQSERTNANFQTQEEAIKVDYSNSNDQRQLTTRKNQLKESARKSKAARSQRDAMTQAVQDRLAEVQRKKTERENLKKRRVESSQRARLNTVIPSAKQLAEKRAKQNN